MSEFEGCTDFEETCRICEKKELDGGSGIILRPLISFANKLPVPWVHFKCRIENLDKDLDWGTYELPISDGATDLTIPIWEEK